MEPITSLDADGNPTTAAGTGTPTGSESVPGTVPGTDGDSAENAIKRAESFLTKGLQSLEGWAHNVALEVKAAISDALLHLGMAKTMAADDKAAADAAPTVDAESEGDTADTSADTTQGSVGGVPVIETAEAANGTEAKTLADGTTLEGTQGTPTGALASGATPVTDGETQSEVPPLEPVAGEAEQAPPVE